MKSSLFFVKVLEKTEKNVNDIKTKVKLNVGGEIFTFTKETLCRFPNTYFTGLLGTGKWKPGEDDDAYFIDRDPFAFDLVARYLRGSELNLLEAQFDAREAFRSHCDYFLLPLPHLLSFFDPSWIITDDFPFHFEIQGNILTRCGRDQVPAYALVKTVGKISSAKIRIISAAYHGALYFGVYKIDSNMRRIEEEWREASIPFNRFIEKEWRPTNPAESKPLTPGDVVEVRHDEVNRTIALILNGQCIRFSSYPVLDSSLPLVIGICSIHKGDSFELVI
jgi:hypothetical protein